MVRTLESVAVANLLLLANACAKARGVSLRTISVHAHGDHPAFDRLVRGEGSITLRKLDQAMAWLRDPTNWPEGTKPPTPWEPWTVGKPRVKLWHPQRKSSASGAAGGKSASATRSRTRSRSAGPKPSSESDSPVVA